MVPAIVELVGDRIWWPGTARGGPFEFHGWFARRDRSEELDDTTAV
jgi:hypothetical protein